MGNVWDPINASATPASLARPAIKVSLSPGTGRHNENMAVTFAVTCNFYHVPSSCGVLVLKQMPQRERESRNEPEPSWLRSESNTKACWHAPALSTGRVIIYCGQSSTTQPQRIKVVADSRSGSWFVSAGEQWGALIMWGKRWRGRGWFSSNGKECWGYAEWSREWILSCEDNISITNLR